MTLDERAPGCTADLKMEEDKRHLSQLIVELCEWSHFSARREAKLL